MILWVVVVVGRCYFSSKAGKGDALEDGLDSAGHIQQCSAGTIKPAGCEYIVF